jgi:hypothetical protein
LANLLTAKSKSICTFHLFCFQQSLRAPEPLLFTGTIPKNGHYYRFERFIHHISKLVIPYGILKSLRYIIIRGAAIIWFRLLNRLFDIKA